MVYKPTSLYIDPTKRTQEMEDFGIRSLPEFKGSAYNLGAIEGFPDVRYATTDYNKYSDLYRLYSGMPGGFDAAQDDFVPPAAPPGGGDSGGGGVGTGGGTGGGTVGDNTYIGGGASLEDAGGTYPGGYHSAEGGFEYTGTPVSPTTQPIDPTGMLPQTSIPFMIPGALGVDPREKNDVLSGAITAKDAADPEGLLSRLGITGFDAKEAAVKAAINAAVGRPVTLLIDALKGLVPPQDPRQTALNEFYPDRTSAGTIASGLMKGYNPVSGGGLYTLTGGRMGEEPTYGLQQAYQDRIDTITESLGKYNKYDPTHPDYDAEKAQQLINRRAQLEADKKAEELATRGARKLVSGDIGKEDTGDAMLAEQIEAQRIRDEADDKEDDMFIPTFDDDTDIGTMKTTAGINPFANMYTRAGEFDTTTPIKTTTYTGPDNVLMNIGNTPLDAFEYWGVSNEDLLGPTQTTTKGPPSVLNPYQAPGTLAGTADLPNIMGEFDMTAFDEPTSTRDDFDFKTTPPEEVPLDMMEQYYKDLDAITPAERWSALTGEDVVQAGGSVEALTSHYQNQLDNIENSIKIGKEIGIDTTELEKARQDILNKIKTVKTGPKIQPASYQIPADDDKPTYEPTFTGGDEWTETFGGGADAGEFDTTPQDTYPKTDMKYFYYKDANTMPPSVRRQQQEDFDQMEKNIISILDSPFADEFIDVFTGAAEDRDVIDRGGGDDIGFGGLDPDRGQQVDRGTSGAGDDRPVTGTTKPGELRTSTYDAELEDERDVGGGGNQGGDDRGSSKIVCTMMNESYGFGSFRNKIWMKFHKDLSPEYQKGYHKLFLPLVKIAKKNVIIKKVLEHIAVHSTIDMRQSMRGKTHLLGRVYRKILLPVCYIVGKYAKK